jgi:hypothetical protein
MQPDNLSNDTPALDCSIWANRSRGQRSHDAAVRVLNDDGLYRTVGYNAARNACRAVYGGDIVQCALARREAGCGAPAGRHVEPRMHARASGAGMGYCAGSPLKQACNQVHVGKALCPAAEAFGALGRWQSSTVKHATCQLSNWPAFPGLHL